MTIEQITDIAYEVASELEPSRSVDVCDVDGSHITFQTEHGLKRVCVACINGPMKDQIKRELCE